jgi:2-succinyl-6-hydroxy-2,4-cyclohexadiene-1-carboxylate synthase
MPMFARLPGDADGLAHRRSNTVAGLAHSLRAYGTGAQTPLWDALGSIEMPVLVLAGELDTKFVEIGVRTADRLPRATFATVPTPATPPTPNVPRPPSP